MKGLVIKEKDKYYAISFHTIKKDKELNLKKK